MIMDRPVNLLSPDSPSSLSRFQAATIKRPSDITREEEPNAKGIRLLIAMGGPQRPAARMPTGNHKIGAALERVRSEITSEGPPRSRLIQSAMTKRERLDRGKMNECLEERIQPCNSLASRRHGGHSSQPPAMPEVASYESN